MVNRGRILSWMLGLISLVTIFGVLASPLVTVFAQKDAVNNPNGKLPPNELGRIMILEYHLIGYPEARWCRTPENFRKDLQMLYDNDYYPVALDDIVSGNFRVPAGKTPFAITFDDSTEGQFRYLKQGDRLVIDPKSAVGIMEQFKKEHPDFPVTATFYVLTGTSAGHRLFGQEEYVQQKLEFLAKNGYEIGNHTHTHENLSKLTDEQVQKQMALNVKTVQKYLPNYEVRSFALPYGVHPKNRNLSRIGEYQGKRYNNRSVMLVGSGSVPSPYSVDFNPYLLERIQAGDFEWGPGAFVQRYKKNPSLRFVSDGDPKVITVFKSQQSKVAPEIAKRFKVKVVED